MLRRETNTTDRNAEVDESFTVVDRTTKHIIEVLP
jgi:hypothetical protein